MARNKKAVLPIKERLLEIHGEMKELIIRAGVQEPKYNFMVKKLDKQSNEYCEILYTWLVRLKDNEYKAASIMWEKLPEHYWENLRTLITAKNLPEQKALNSKFRSLREVFSNWPRSVKEKSNE